jgi:hypothetical protein
MGICVGAVTEKATNEKLHELHELHATPYFAAGLDGVAES